MYNHYLVITLLVLAVLVSFVHLLTTRKHQERRWSSALSTLLIVFFTGVAIWRLPPLLPKNATVSQEETSVSAADFFATVVAETGGRCVTDQLEYRCSFSIVPPIRTFSQTDPPESDVVSITVSAIRIHENGEEFTEADMGGWVDYTWNQKTGDVRRTNH